jgi:hypothetical protein
VDKTDLRPKEHIKKLHLYAQKANVRTKVDTFKKEEKFHMPASREGQDLRNNEERRKYNSTLMSLVNNECKDLRGTIVILY